MSEMKLTRLQLHMMAWLADLSGRRVMTIGSGGRLSLYEIGPSKEDGKFPIECVYPHPSIDRDVAKAADIETLKAIGGRDTVDIGKLVQSRLVSNWGTLRNSERRNEFIAKLARDPFHYSENVVRLTKQGRDWWNETGKAQYEKVRDADEAVRNASERVVVLMGRAEIDVEQSDVVKRAREAGLNLPDMRRHVMRPYGTATVVRETAQRLYIEDCRPFDHGARFDYSDIPVKGREPNLYAERTSVMADDVTLSQAARLANLDAEYADEIRQRSQEALHQIIPILVDADLRMKQKMAERSDMIRELLDEMGKSESCDASVEANLSFRR